MGSILFFQRYCGAVEKYKCLPKLAEMFPFIENDNSDTYRVQ